MSESQKNLQARFSGAFLRRSGWAALICTMIAVLIANNYFTNPAYIRQRAEDYLQRFLRGRVSVGSAEFSWFDGIRLHEVTIYEAPAGSDSGFENKTGDSGGTLYNQSAESEKQIQTTVIEAQPPIGIAAPRLTEVAGETVPEPDSDDLRGIVFRCPQAVLSHDLSAALLGKLRIKAIAALEPTCVIARDAVTGVTNLAGLVKPVDALSMTKGGIVPTIELQDARIRVVRRYPEHDRVVEDLRLTIRGRHPSPDTHFYDIVWHDLRKGGTTGVSQIDLDNGHIRNVRGGLPWMSLEAVLIGVNASYDTAGTWSDLLGLDGAIRASDYSLGNDGIGTYRRWAAIELDDASLAVPISAEEESLPASERYLRFEKVYGTIQVTADGIRAEFDGRFHGAPCLASVHMCGGLNRIMTLDDVDFEADLKLSDLTLPRAGEEAPLPEARFISRWPQLARFFREYDPHGRVGLHLIATKKAGPEERLEVARLAVTAISADASFHTLPYRLENVRGTVEFSPSLIELRGIAGRHDGGQVQINGTVRPEPGRPSTVELAIAGTGIPIDGELIGAVPAEFQGICERLRPTGRIDLELALSRAPVGDNEHPRWSSHCIVSLNDITAGGPMLPRHVDHVYGKLEIKNRQFEVNGVRGLLGGADVGVDALVRPTKDPDAPDLDLTVWGKDVTIESALIDALPEDIKRQVIPFHLEGKVDFTTALKSRNDGGGLDHQTRVSFHAAGVRYDGFPVSVQDLQGDVSINRDGIEVHGLSGSYNGAEVFLEGSYRATGGRYGQVSSGRGETDVFITCRNLCPDAALLAAVPEGLRTKMEGWRVGDPVDVDVVLREGSGEDSGKVEPSAIVRLSGVAVQHSSLPDSFKNVRAEIHCDGSGLKSTGATAKYGTAEIRADLELHRTDSRVVAGLRLAAEGVRLDRSTRDLLPAALQRSWDYVAPSGLIDLDIERASYERGADETRGTWDIKGRVGLRDAALDRVADVHGAAGTLTVRGRFTGKSGGAALDGELHLGSVRLFGQSVRNLSAAWSYARTADGLSGLRIDNVEADIHGGSLNGRLEVLGDLDSSTYEIGATVRGMDVEPFLVAVHSSRGDDEPVTARGIADARLFLSGKVAGSPRAKPERTLMGGGRVEVSEAYMYRLPILLAVLNVFNLAVPDDNAFHDAAFDFQVLDKRVYLEDISLQGPVLNLVGRGSVSVPDRGVNLYLVNVPNWMTRVPGLDVFVAGVSKELIELHVTGPLYRPAVRPAPFRATIKELKKLFQKKPPRQLRAAAP